MAALNEFESSMREGSRLLKDNCVHQQESRDQNAAAHGLKELVDRAGSISKDAADVDPEEEECAYVDKRWRQIDLVPKGKIWAARLKGLGQEVQQDLYEGLVLLPRR